MTCEEYWAYLRAARGIAPTGPSTSEGSRLCQDPNGDFFEIPDPEEIPATARQAFAQVLLDNLRDYHFGV